RERSLQSIPNVSLEQLRRDGWPEPVLQGEVGSVNGLRDLMRVLRNSIAHFNIEFTEIDGEISGVRLSNRDGGQTRWQATLGLEDLEQITYRFAALILEEGGDDRL
ncbi:MAG TPA: HEPN family nuclease, partial [Lacipirellulaceae bacterium]|nr:HEPN family nuclease [Lacipirellulaceae bacterium]